MPKNGFASRALPYGHSVQHDGPGTEQIQTIDRCGHSDAQLLGGVVRVGFYPMRAVAI